MKHFNVKKSFSKGWYYAVIAMLLLGCKSNSEKVISEEQYKELLSQSYMLTPDSLLTPEDIALKIKVMDFLTTNITFTENHQQLPVTRQELESKGIPSFYYDILQYQVNETNAAIDRWIKEGSIAVEDLDMEALLKQAKDLYWNVERPQLVSRVSASN